MGFLKVLDVSKKEGDGFVLQNINFGQKQFQKIAIAGATGSGKTTLLKIIAGLVQPDAGSILFESERVIGPEEKLIPGHPRIAYLSQHFELRNHYRVKELLSMANQLSESGAQSIYEVCRIDHLLNRWTHQLSGGEKQRIALACLLVKAPKLLLLDEPYSNLDAIHKSILKSVIEAIGQQLNITCLLVSHDSLDILSWADEILVLQAGQIIQSGNPEKIYKEPVNEYAAALFGKYSLMDFSLAKAFSAFTDLELNRINGFIRPEDFKIVPRENLGLKGEVRKLSFLGSYYEAEIMIGENKIVVNTGQKNLAKGDIVFVSLG
ncbi:MAG: ABC transporter ATP-binding protein [Flavisolibacter sp.]